MPNFLPSFPSRHTYSLERNLVVKREEDMKKTRMSLLDQKNQVQQSLHGLQQAFESIFFFFFSIINI